jgi:hypothetical protein
MSTKLTFIEKAGSFVDAGKLGGEKSTRWNFADLDKSAKVRFAL